MPISKEFSCFIVILQQNYEYPVGNFQLYMQVSPIYWYPKDSLMIKGESNVLLPM